MTINGSLIKVGGIGPNRDASIDHQGNIGRAAVKVDLSCDRLTAIPCPRCPSKSSLVTDIELDTGIDIAGGIL